MVGRAGFTAGIGGWTGGGSVGLALLFLKEGRDMYVCLDVFNRMTCLSILTLSKDYVSVSRVLDCFSFLISFRFVSFRINWSSCGCWRICFVSLSVETVKIDKRFYYYIIGILIIDGIGLRVL